ncbi:hypothetical protein MJA45_12050 [Paenibacillus aurantius]|uniref:Uncharacterized protein n=1 Tax=Paenibacillus aurantius TaxID=2918900 RepID=A0AA96LM22_9BACL|nr:hypothetical protein [Paenibacillus aurantius]WNQ13712.1 hypothetical protein MJA45_12050 [Paenibacillus aurantius]
MTAAVRLLGTASEEESLRKQVVDEAVEFMEKIAAIRIRNRSVSAGGFFIMESLGSGPGRGDGV